MFYLKLKLKFFLLLDFGLIINITKFVNNFQWEIYFLMYQTLRIAAEVQ